MSSELLPEAAPSIPYGLLSFDEVATEQKEAQSDKCGWRTLADYNEYIFYEQDTYVSWEGPTGAILKDKSNGDEDASLINVLEGIAEEKGRPAHWADMGGGHGFAMRGLSLVCRSKDKAKPAMTHVDALVRDPNEISSVVMDITECNYPDILNPKYAPDFIQADIHTVVLEEPADVITAVEVVQYLNNPLAAIASWYNQLAEDGALVVTSDHAWGTWNRYSESTGPLSQQRFPIEDFIVALRRAGARCAVSSANRSPDRENPENMEKIRRLVIEKMPDTEVVINSELDYVYTNQHDYKIPYYKTPEQGVPLVEVSATNT